MFASVKVLPNFVRALEGLEYGGYQLISFFVFLLDFSHVFVKVFVEGYVSAGVCGNGYVSVLVLVFFPPVFKVFVRLYV